MKNLRRVVWTKGMFLTPQHFQAQDRYFDDALDFRFRQSNFANWGVSDLKIDREALESGTFRLESCGGLMPDGLLFDMPFAEPLPEGRGIEKYFPSDSSHLDAFLAVPELKSRSRNTTLLSGPEAANTRYVAETASLLDENGEPDEKPVQLGRKNFRILFGSEPHEGFVTMRLGQIIRESDGSYGLNPKVVAPCLNIESSPFIQDLLRRLVEILGSKVTSLRESRREGARGVAKFTPTDLADYWLLHSLSSHLPLLNHYWKVRRGHAEGIYVELLQLAGALSSFSLEGDPLRFPTYDHNDCGPCFDRLDASLRAMLQVARRDDCVTIPLVSVDRYIWQGSILDDGLFDGNRFFLSVSASLGVDDLIRMVPVAMKLAAPDDIQRLVDRALPGIGLRHEPAPPSAIRLGLDNQCFSINQSGPLWDALVQNRAASLYIPNKIPDANVELLVALKTD